jgi:integrase
MTDLDVPNERIVLNARNVSTVPKGAYHDDLVRGLILLVRPSAKAELRRSWVLRVTISGKRKRIGLGPLSLTGLAEARQKAREALRLIDAGADPSRAGKARQRAADEARTLTFKGAMDLYLAEAARAYKNPKSEAIRTRALQTICAPLHLRPVETISPRDIQSTLKAFTPETQRKALAAIRAVFDLALVEMEQRGSPLNRNPASPDLMRAVGYRRPSRAADRPHPALDFRQAPAFMAELVEVGTPAARLIEFIILTASRSGAARLCRYDQIDANKRLWRIPAAQLKDSNHRSGDFVVPLSPAALAAVETMQLINSRRHKPSRYVFAENDGDGPLREDRLTTLIRNLRRKSGWRDPHSERPIVIHGFRASFRTWVETTRRHDKDFAEISLGHKVNGEVAARYIRTGLIDERRKLLDEWARHCSGQSAEVIPLWRGQ